jgi:hypothetical protein
MSLHCEFGDAVLEEGRKIKKRSLEEGKSCRLGNSERVERVRFMYDEAP